MGRMHEKIKSQRECEGHEAQTWLEPHCASRSVMMFVSIGVGAASKPLRRSTNAVRTCTHCADRCGGARCVQCVGDEAGGVNHPVSDWPCISGRLWPLNAHLPPATCLLPWALTIPHPAPHLCGMYCAPPRNAQSRQADPALCVLRARMARPRTMQTHDQQPAQPSPPSPLQRLRT